MSSWQVQNNYLDLKPVKRLFIAPRPRLVSELAYELCILRAPPFGDLHEAWFRKRLSVGLHKLTNDHVVGHHRAKHLGCNVLILIDRAFANTALRDSSAITCTNTVFIYRAFHSFDARVVEKNHDTNSLFFILTMRFL